MQCPICDEPLIGHAELTPEGQATTIVNECPQCGRYAMSPEVAGLVAAAPTRARFNLMARLETRSVPAGPDGTMVILPAELGR